MILIVVVTSAEVFSISFFYLIRMLYITIIRSKCLLVFRVCWIENLGFLTRNICLKIPLNTNDHLQCIKNIWRINQRKIIFCIEKPTKLWQKKKKNKPKNDKKQTQSRKHYVYIKKLKPKLYEPSSGKVNKSCSTIRTPILSTRSYFFLNTTRICRQPMFVVLLKDRSV